MVKNIGWSVVALAGSLVAAAPATAQVATISVTGTVMSGADGAGIFGAANASLVGQAFSAVFNIKPDTGATSVTTATLSQLFGNGSASPVDAYLTIGGNTHYFSGMASSSALVQNGAGNGGTDKLLYFTDSTDYGINPVKQTLFYVGVDTLRNIIEAADFASYPNVDVTLQDNAKGFAQVANYDKVSGSYGNVTYADLAVKTIGAKVSAVPEPSTWMLMIAGFGTVGYAMRRRKVSYARTQVA